MSQQKLLLVGWDGADWQIAKPLMEQGLMPQLSELVKNGASGPILSLQPYLSPMLWNIIGTGKHPAEHGIVGFTELNPVTRQIQPMSSRSRRVKALWNILSQNGLRTHVFGWFASHPAEKINGVYVAETFAKFSKKTPSHEYPDGSVYPPEAAEYLADMRLAPDEVEVQLLEFFIPKIDAIDLRRDNRPDQLLTRLSELYTLHNSAVATLQDEPESHFLAVYFHFLDWICHDFIEYAAPQRPGISDRDFELYKNVVNQGYVLQDLLLRDLLSHVNADTTCMVVSDHGFLSGDNRPKRTPRVTAGIAAWHNPEGVIAMAGPTIQKGVRIDGAKLFDVTPTVLHTMGLSVGEDMRGRVIEEAFLPEFRKVTKIPSWETVGPPLASFQGTEMGADASKELLSQFEDLGYIDLQGDVFESAESLTQRENAWNLGQALLNDNRLDEALVYLNEAYFYNPEQLYLAMPLARCQAQLGLIGESKETAQTIADYSSRNPQASLLLAELCILWKEYTTALEHLKSASENGVDLHSVNLQKGLVLLYLERFEEAELLFRQCHETAPTENTLLGLCRALTRGGKAAEAKPLVDSLLEAHPNNARGWFTRGQIETALKNPEAAAEALRKAASLEPNFLNAQFNLSQAERSVLEGRGHFVPYEAPDLDFSDPNKREREIEATNKAHLSKLRAGTKARLQVRLEQREAERAKAEPLAEYRIDDRNQPAADQAPITIVTGLPRSGTSMMMQLLQAGGMTLKIDGVREADVHNQKGYYEWEAIKTLGKHPEVIDEAAGMAVKVVSIQLNSLPKGRAYNLIWMDRPVEEVARSQEKMILEEHPDRELPDQADRIRTLTQHRDAVLKAFRAFAQDDSNRIKMIEIGYHDCLHESQAVIDRLNDFLCDNLVDPENLAGYIDTQLWRERPKTIE